MRPWFFELLDHLLRSAVPRLGLESRLLKGRRLIKWADSERGMWAETKKYGKKRTERRADAAYRYWYRQEMAHGRFRSNR